MPPRKRQQSNAMLYTLIAFVGLFIIAATFAVIYYVKAEDFKAKEAAAKRAKDELANSAEHPMLGTIVGTRQGRKTWIGTLAEHYDKVIWLVAGDIPQDMPADIKLKNVIEKAQAAMLLAQEYVDLTNADPNTAGLTRVIESLKNALDNAVAANLAVKANLENVQQSHDDAIVAAQETEQILLAQKDLLVQRVVQAEKDYDDLTVLLRETTDREVQNYVAKLQEEQGQRKQLDEELLATQAQLDLTAGKMRLAQQEVALINPPPDSNAPALLADGKIILVDRFTKVVHIDKGTDDHLYPGMTFAVHDKNAPIPKDGKGKAEIEVFDVRKTISAARILNPDERRPILENDVITNLIWDSDKENVFVIAGEFNLDGKGGLDADAAVKIKTLIEKWGGRVDESITVDTDFLVIGKQPSTLPKPSFDDLEIDPKAMDKHEASLRKLGDYKNIQTQARELWIPVFTYDRFLHFIGYKQQSANAGAF